MDDPDEHFADPVEAAAGSPAVRPRGILWDVIDEHLDEAAYAITRFLRGLHSCTLTLDDLTRYPEEGLTAHVDALVLGGAAVREHTLLPALVEADAEEPDRITAAALVLIESGRFDELTAFWGHELEPVRAAVTRAGRLAAHGGLDQWRGVRASHSMHEPLRASLLALGSARHKLLHPVLDALQSSSVPLALAAAQAALYGDPNTYLPLMQHLLEHESWAVREAALVACLTWGSQVAWAQARRWALDLAQPSPLATQLFAALGSQAEQHELAALLAQPATRGTILFALGFSGDAELAPVLWPYLESKDPVEARLAAQALGITFGFAPADEPFARPPEPAKESSEPLPPPEEDVEALAALPALSDDDLDADLIPAYEEELPPPDVDAIRKFCALSSGSLSGSRALYGAPYSAARAVALLSSCPMRWRHVLAASLFIRSTGTFRLDTYARTAAQRLQLAAMPTRSLSRYVRW